MLPKSPSESVEAYLKRRVLDPIGLNVGFWRKDADGNINLPSGAFLTAREWVKFGELIRLKRKWQGKQIVDSNLLSECFKPAEANANYGMTFWLLGENPDASESDGDNRKASDATSRSGSQSPRSEGPKDIVAAMGKGKQRCYIIPSLELVIVRLGDSVGREFDDQAFLSKILLNSHNESVPK